jgi:acyl carrier protein
MAHGDAEQTMTSDAILARLRDIVWRVVDEQDRERIDQAAITDQTELASLPLDSLATIELMYAIEETFNVSISEDQAFELHTVGNVIRFIQDQQPHRAMP